MGESDEREPRPFFPDGRDLDADSTWIGAGLICARFRHGDPLPTTRVDLNQQGSFGTGLNNKWAKASIELGIVRGLPRDAPSRRQRTGNRRARCRRGPVSLWSDRAIVVMVNSKQWPREEDNDPIDCCHDLLLIGYGIRPGNGTCTNRTSRAGRNDHASCRGLRSGQNAHRWRLHGEDDSPPDPSRGSSLRTLAGRRLRTVSVKQGNGVRISRAVAMDLASIAMKPSMLANFPNHPDHVME